jgi:diguanylate cyclase (GGDEF)-like protein
VPHPDPDLTLKRAAASLGRALSVAVDTVVADLEQRDLQSRCVLDDAVEALILAIARSSTATFALWLSTGDEDTARREGLDASRIFGQLAARNDAPLNEVTKRCLRWHDAVAVQLNCDAARLRLEHGLPLALSMLQRSLNVTIVRMTEAFEVERQHLHQAVLAHQEEIAFQAAHDALTGLPNRALIIDRIEQYLHRHGRFGTGATVLFIDLDNFKAVNDNFGHTVGDELLRAVARRVGEVLRESDTLGRLGGDEFIVVSNCVPPDDAPELICRRTLDALREPFVLESAGSVPITVTASIGVATGAHGPAEEILQDADIAMYRAKREGKNRFVHFESEMLDDVATWFELDGDLKKAVEGQEFFLEYQPVIKLATMSITGAEALLRWRHPTRGTIPPGEFISHLEESNQISVVGRWVLDQACHDGAEWHRLGYPLEVSVNLSARQLDTDPIVTDIQAALDRNALAADHLCVEVTESAMMRDLDMALLRLRAIGSLGVRIAIDDFGTGYSSFAHLERLPVDVLKIDQSFIQRLSNESSARVLVHAQIQLAKALRIETLAEGVEEPYQLDCLKEEACTSAQGFLLCRPLAARAIPDFIVRWDERVARGVDGVHRVS